MRALCGLLFLSLQVASAQVSEVRSAEVLSAEQNPLNGGGAYIEIQLDGLWAHPEVDASKVSATVISKGYRMSKPTTIQRSIQCLSQRYWHEREGVANGGSEWYVGEKNGHSVIHLVMASPIYAEDQRLQLHLEPDWIQATNRSGQGGTLSVTNHSDAPYPQMQAQWATENFRPLLLDKATFEVCAHSAHAFDLEQAGTHRPADAVIFEISNGTKTLTAISTEITHSTYADEVDDYLLKVFGEHFGENGDQPLKVTRPKDAYAQPVFAVTVDLKAAGFQIGDALTVNARAVPFIGDESNLLTTDRPNKVNFHTQTHQILGTQRRFVSFDQNASQSAQPSQSIHEAVAHPGSDFESALEACSRANGGNLDGVVLMLPPGRPELGVRNYRIGGSGKPIDLTHSLTGFEMIPRPGIDGAAVTLQKPKDLSYLMPGRVRAYGMHIDMSMRSKYSRALPMGNGNQSGYLTHAALFLQGSQVNGPSGDGATFTDADQTFVMGGQFASLGSGSFNQKTSVRGASVRDGEAGPNYAPLVLGVNLGSFRLLSDLPSSSISCAGKMRWTCTTTSPMEPISHNMENREGFSLLLCAAYGPRDSLGSWGYLFNADKNDQALQHMHIAMTTLLGGRANMLYDHNPNPSGAKYPNEIYGSVLSSENMKRPAFGMRFVDPSEYHKLSRWGAADPFWYGSGKAWNVLCVSYSELWSPNSYLGPYRMRGYRYADINKGSTADPEMPMPYANPAEGDWTVLTDSEWQSLKSTKALIISPDRDPKDRDQYQSNIITDMVPAEQVPVPFDLYGRPYPDQGHVEAGAIQRVKE